jgi:hypothetical protein
MGPFYGHRSFSGRTTARVRSIKVKNAQIGNGLELYYQVDSFLYVTLFRFQQVNDSTTINSTIGVLDVQGYNFKLDIGLLHPLVFENFNTLECYGVINSIQNDLFKNFLQSVYIIIQENSLGSFYHRIGLEWAFYLQEDTDLILNSDIIPYTYPDRDFCIFVNFSKMKMKVQLGVHEPYEMTFTYTWLCLTMWDSIRSVPPCENATFNSTDLDQMLNLCQIKENESGQKEQPNSYSSYSDFYQTRLIRMLSIELVPFVFIPCACFIGLFLNWNIIRTISENKKKELKEDFYKYMSANAKFNCFYCLIFVFYPMTSCTWNLSNHFCSSVYTSQFVQYYKIVMMAYFGEVVKMCANISYLMMTLNRYVLVGKNHPPWLMTLAKLEFKWVIRGSFLFSALINIGHGWEYQAAKDLAVTLYIGHIFSNYVNYFDENGDSYSDYPEANKDTWYLVYSIVYFMLNFGVFFILNTVIEVKIVRRMQKELKNKRERMARMKSLKTSTSSTALNLEAHKCQAGENMKKVEDEDRKKERKVIKMVVLNGFFNLIVRAPDLLFWMENKKMMYDILPRANAIELSDNSVRSLSIKNAPGLINLIADVAYLTYILTFTTNFVIFYKFNKKFKEAIEFF